MKRAMTYTVLVVAGAWLLQWLMAIAAPNLIMQVVYKRLSSVSGANALFYAGTIDHFNRKVVRPSPDLQYGGCAYDLGEGNVVIKAQVPQKYWSLQFYQMNTDNFASITNQREQAFRSGTDVTVIISLEPLMTLPEIINVVSPTVKGVALLRLDGLGDTRLATEALANTSCQLAR